MIYILEYIPEVDWEPDTDKWRLFPESKLNKEWYDQFCNDFIIDEVQKLDRTGDPIYLVHFEASNTKDAFVKGYDLIINYMEKELSDENNMQIM